MNVEIDFPKSRIHSFLKAITELCKKHNVSIYIDEVKGIRTTILEFPGWNEFIGLEADPTSSSVYWPRIESLIMYEEKVGKDG